MLVNKQIVIDNLLEQPDEYRKQFPKFIAEIDQLVKKPKCGVCISGFFKAILKQADVSTKMAILFKEEDLKFAQDIQQFQYKGIDKPPLKTSTKVEVYFLEVSEYKKFVEEYTKQKLVRSISPIYIPAEGKTTAKIMVTLHWSSLT